MGFKLVELGLVDQAHDRSGPFAGAQTPGKQAVLPPEWDRPDDVFHSIVVERRIAVSHEARRKRPATQP